jgi:hypothetical protein
MTSRSRFRMALLGEGVHVVESTTVGGVDVTRPDARIGRENREVLQQLLDQSDFRITIDHPTWMANAATRRPVYFLVTPWLEADSAAEAHSHLNNILSMIVDTLSLSYGGEPRTIGYVMEIGDPGQTPRPVIVAVGGPPWPTSQLQRLAPADVQVPVSSVEDLYQSMAHRPRVALWARLFTPIAGEHRWDLRVLRLSSLLEGVAREVNPSIVTLAQTNGTALLDREGRTATTADFRGRLYQLVEAACRGVGIPNDTLIATPNETLWTEVGVWADLRNVVAHDGRWLPAPAPTGLPSPRDRSEAAAKLASQDGVLDEGLIRYSDCIMAATEVVLWHASAGGFDPAT